MTQSTIKYLGPLHEQGQPEPRDNVLAAIKRVPMLFVAIVVLPTVIAAIYFFIIATPRYVSEAHFVVRSQKTEQPSSLGVALQGVGIPTSSTDSFAVHQYIRSPDGLRALMQQYDVQEMYSRPGSDVFSRVPGLFHGNTFDDFYTGFKKYLTVGYDSTTGISVIRVEAFTPADAEAMTAGYLQAGEALVNRLNERSSAGAVADAEGALRDAQARMITAQSELTAFRNREGSLDPERSAVAGGELIGALSLSLAETRAERAQVAADAPASPQISALDGRIRALESQIRAENRRLAGDATSLAPKIGRYETLILEQEMAGKNLASANASLVSARLDERRQQLYLERVVEPSRPEIATRPRRMVTVLSVFLSCLIAYGTIWLIIAGLRESKQD